MRRENGAEQVAFYKYVVQYYLKRERQRLVNFPNTLIDLDVSSPLSISVGYYSLNKS